MTTSTSTTKSISLKVKLNSLHLLSFIFPMLLRATILHSVLNVVAIHSFQSNKNFDIVIFPRTFRNANSVSPTRTTVPFPFTNDNAYCEQSILEYRQYSNNNKNDLIRLYSTPMSNNNNSNNNDKDVFSLPNEETKNINLDTKKNKRKEEQSIQPKETITSKTIVNIKETNTDTVMDLKQKQKQKQGRRSWESSYRLLKQYKEQHGDCLVPPNYNQDKRLGIWVYTQRQQAKNGLLKPGRKEKLDEIGFSWEAWTDNWNYMMEQLKEFQEEFGHCNVEVGKHKSRQTLAFWVVNQRQRRPLLTNKQCSQLDELGFVWGDVQKARGDRQWEERFEALQDYQRIYGDTRVPESASHKNVNLGKWVSRQRYHYHKGILRKDREDKLNSIGFIWKLRDQNLTDYDRINKNWMKNLEKLKDFKTIHNHTNVPKRYEEDLKLGVWVDNQRLNYRLGILKKSRQEMLESIGFEWNPKEKVYDEQWMDHYQHLIVFRNKHGHVNVPSSSYLNLYDWLYRQRIYFANNKLELERKELLEKLGVNLTVGPGSGNTMID